MEEKIVSLRLKTLLVRIVIIIAATMYEMYATSKLTGVPFLALYHIVGYSFVGLVYIFIPYILVEFPPKLAKLGYWSLQAIVIGNILLIMRDTGEGELGLLAIAGILCVNFFAPWNIEYEYTERETYAHIIDIDELIEKLKKYSRRGAWVYRFTYLTLPLEMSNAEMTYLAKNYPTRRGFRINEVTYNFTDNDMKPGGFLEANYLIEDLPALPGGKMRKV